MIEHFVDITTPDGTMNTFVVHPERDGPSPVVLFLMDAPGMREELRDMSRRIASAGYYVMASQLYYREVTEYNLFETNDRDRMFELMSNLSNAMVVEDAKAMIAHAETDPAASTERIGTAGFCMSGPFTVMIAAALPDQVKAAASFHGVALVTDRVDSPHKHLSAINGEVYIGAAETDSYAPPEMIDAFESALAEASLNGGAKGRTEWYPGTEHGFVFAERPLYDKPSSERAWARMHSLFRRQLHQN